MKAKKGEMHALKKWVLTALLSIPAGIQSADLSMLQILQVSNYNDISSMSIPGTDIVQTDFQPVYLLSYYFLDTRFQNIGEDQWMFRGLFKMKALFTDNRYIPDFRYGYVENKKPMANHWYVSAGRLTTFNFLPVQRLDGANIGFTPDPDKGWLFGLIGGMIPVETSGYRNLYLYNSPYRAGAYAEYRSKKADHIKLQYNAGFNASTDLFHQAMGEFTKKYQIFKLDSFLRGGILYTAPYNTFDYAFAENSLHATQKFIHSLGYLKSETIFLSGDSYTKVDFQQAFYRMSYTSNDDVWHLNVRGGYTYSMEKDGYIAQTQLMMRKLFEGKNGVAGIDLLAQKKGVYDQYLAKVNFGLLPIGYVNINVYAGYEYMMFRDNPNSAFVYGLNLGGEFLGGFNYDLNLDGRTIFNENTEIYAGFNLVHFFKTHLGKKEKTGNPTSGDSLKPDWKEQIKTDALEKTPGTKDNQS